MNNYAWLLLLITGLTLPVNLIAADPTDETGFVSLFDGKTFEGWEGNLKMFRIEDGTIIAGTLAGKIPNNEFLCTKTTYGDFELRLQARLRGDGQNAGVQFRSERVPNHHEVSGYQCDMGMMQQRPIWGWLYDESRRNKFLAEAEDAPLKKALNATDWNDLTIRCTGPHIEIWVNDIKTVDYMESDLQVSRRGIIGLQIHGGAPAEAAYRKIRLKKL